MISSSPFETIVELGASFSLDCIYEGFPSPMVVWTMNNVLLTNESSHDVTIVNIINSSTSNTSRLSRTITSSHTGPGKYSCILVSSAGATINTFDVYLKSKLNSNLVGRNILSNSNNISVAFFLFKLVQA